MNPIRILRFPAAAAFLFLFAAAANGEAIFRVNTDNTGTWIFDQPSVVAGPSVLHVAFVGYGEGTGNRRLYYAAVNPGADFASKNTLRAQAMVTEPVLIADGDGYTDARHPQIAFRTDTELVVVFQAVPSGLGAGSYRLFRARITLANNAVTSQAVAEVLDSGDVRLSGTLVDPSFGVVASDNSLRVAYTDNAAGNVYFARVGIDNANVVGSPILLSSEASSRGDRPIPRLALDGNNYSHVVWAANDDSDAEPTSIYYSLVRANTSGVKDNLAIGATQILSAGRRWGFPVVLVHNNSSIWVIAANQPYGQPGQASSLGIVALNPYAVTHDGNPVDINNVSVATYFFLTPPGQSVLDPSFDLYQPEAAFDGTRQIHIAGYGYRSVASPFQGSPGRYYSLPLGNLSANNPTFSVSPMPVGTGDISFGTQSVPDYTRPAFAHYNGRAIHFWSGIDATDTACRNLYFTATPDTVEPGTQSGCSVAGGPGAGGAPGADLLLLPTLLLLLRLASRKPVARE